jgi:polyisoprenoid-binding protein YceI
MHEIFRKQNQKMQVLKPPVIAILLLSLCGVASRATPSVIDTTKSVLTVRVFKTGFFSAFAHDHEINAPIERGSFSEDPASVELNVDARKLKVVDKGVSDNERDKVQKNMQGSEVLDSEKFPEIRFHSTSVERAGGAWQVTGDLTLHGETHPVAFKVQKVNGHYQGKAEVKQKDYGIAPISIAGGSVKVKNEVRIEFDIVGQ